MASIVARIALTVTEDRLRVLYLSGRRYREARAAAEWRTRMSWYPHGLEYAKAHMESEEQAVARAAVKAAKDVAALNARLDAIEAIPDPIARRLERLERHLGVKEA